MKNLAREKSFEIVKATKDVKINHDKINEVARNWLKQGTIVPKWPQDFHFKSLDYLIILDSINFCFWSKNKKRWEINYNGKKYNGYFALSLALKDFFEKNPEKASLDYFSNISYGEFIVILRGGNNLQFLKKRFQIVKEVSSEIINKYGSAEKLVKSAGKNFSNLVGIIKNLSYFNDPFLKRAQILACDIYGAFDGKGSGEFYDLDYLTAFADYKVPQILNYLGILEYSQKLDKKINNKILISSGSAQEAEIRASTIVAVEYLRKALKNKFYSFEIDWILWNRAQFSIINKPYHLTRTLYY
jgi:hypothetical protein